MLLDFKKEYFISIAFIETKFNSIKAMISIWGVVLSASVLLEVVQLSLALAFWMFYYFKNVKYHWTYIYYLYFILGHLLFVFLIFIYLFIFTLSSF